MPPQPANAPPATGLRQVLDLEAELSADLKAAQAEAAAIREAAVQAAAEAARAAEAETHQEEERLLIRSAEQGEQEAARVRADLERRIQALEQLVPERLETIARGLMPLLVPTPNGAKP